MRVGEKSLRFLVDKWFGPTSTMPVHVTQFSHTRHDPRRYVRIEAIRSTGILAILFFLHDDGSWYVFPPAIKRPSMNTH